MKELGISHHLCQFLKDNEILFFVFMSLDLVQGLGAGISPEIVGFFSWSLSWSVATQKKRRLFLSHTDFELDTDKTSFS